jgi:hypothetical protein
MRLGFVASSSVWSKMHCQVELSSETILLIDDIPEQRRFRTAYGRAIITFFLVEEITAFVERINLQGGRQKRNAYAGQ